MKTASEEFFVRLRYWFVSGGRITRRACGRTTSRKVGAARRPSAWAASLWPFATDCTPARTSSAMKAAV